MAGLVSIMFCLICIYYCIYITNLMIMKEAKVFKSGNSQAIRIPKEFQIDTDTVKINRVGNLLVIIPEDTPEWEMFKEGIAEAADFPEVNEIPIPNPSVDLE